MTECMSECVFNYRLNTSKLKLIKMFSGSGI